MPNLALKPLKVAHYSPESVDFPAFLFVSLNYFWALVFYYHNQLSAGESVVRLSSRVVWCFDIALTRQSRIHTCTHTHTHIHTGTLVFNQTKRKQDRQQRKRKSAEERERALGKESEWRRGAEKGKSVENGRAVKSKANEPYKINRQQDVRTHTGRGHGDGDGKRTPPEWTY